MAKQPLWAVPLKQRGAAIEEWGGQAGAPPTFFRNYPPGVRTDEAKNRDSVEEVFRLTLQAFERSKLAKDILWAISRLGEGKKFIGHDSRECAIVSGDRKPKPKSFIDVAVKVDGEDKAIVRVSGREWSYRLGAKAARGDR
jgi:hypothetical protein